MFNLLKRVVLKEKFIDIPKSKIIKTGQTVSRLGFGGYRVVGQNSNHRLSLYKSIQNGINVIDTSTHFEAGKSEEMIGEVMEDVIKRRMKNREEIVVISKAGYVNTDDPSYLDDTRFAKINKKSAHSISTDFLEKEISESLRRLRMKKVDIFMINNPERILKATNKIYSLDRLYKDITAACVFLDEECKKGRIGGYGICSNSMAIPKANDHISLPKILADLPANSRYNLVAIETPLNIFERDVLESNGELHSLADIAKMNDIFLFTNRPLHAIAGGTIHKLVNNKDDIVSEQEILGNLELSFTSLNELENKLSETLGIGFPISTKFVWSNVLAENLARLSKSYFAASHYLEKEVLPSIMRDLKDLSDHNKNTEELDREEKFRVGIWISDYEKQTRCLIQLILSYARVQALQRNDELETLITNFSPSLSESYSPEEGTKFDDMISQYSPLSVKALRIILADQRVGCALIGMRRPEHVKDALLALELHQKEHDNEDIIPSQDVRHIPEISINPVSSYFKKISDAKQLDSEKSEDQENDVFAVPMSDHEESTRPTKKPKKSKGSEQQPSEEKGKQKEIEVKEPADKKPATRKASKTKKDNEEPTVTSNTIPNNTTMPKQLVFPAKPEGTVKFVSWNVSGLKASLKKGFKFYVQAEDPDILCLQETKINEPMYDIVDGEKYKCREWGFEDKKGYGGIAIFSKIEPISKTYGLPTHPKPDITKGRIITLEFPTLYYVACYVPNAGEKLVRLKEKIEWDNAMEKYLRELDAKKPVIWAGDLNVAHKEIDLARPESNSKTAGFTREERQDFEKILNGGEDKFIDTWRHFHPDTKGVYTYYSYRFQARVKGIGWRLDYHVVSERLLDRVVESEMRSECWGASDHIPLVLLLKDDL
ncbi:12789_t:CDS:10 [Ambispora leptoticha]|uniref:12789_t:CDS:1 n=1 Tax=Ambispora leptoticha TaxID=144679 RepID=A0A9N8VKN7_9GLOM|nr:12789_t:CDS:10 [Ambispora leptoticha]